MELRKKLAILDLSLKEEKVLLAVIKGIKTPLLITRETKVTRPAVYDILLNLKDRGLVKSHIVEGKKSWSLARKENIDESLYEAKKVLLSVVDGVEEVKGMSDGTIIVHKGEEAVRKLVSHIARNHKDERLQSMQGDKIFDSWDAVVGKEIINDFNHNVKKNSILTESIIPNGWFEGHIKSLGDVEGFTWAQGFINRALATYQIDKKYFNHAGQIFIFKSSLYLISMNEVIIIEIRNSELQKMIKQMFSFIEDHAEKIDVNSMLQKKIALLSEV